MNGCCKSWARDGKDVLFSEHHPDCEERDIEVEAKTHLENILKALEHEAKMGDGFADAFFGAYRDAKFFTTGKVV